MAPFFCSVAIATCALKETCVSRAIPRLPARRGKLSPIWGMSPYQCNLGPLAAPTQAADRRKEQGVRAPEDSYIHRSRHKALAFWFVSGSTLQTHAPTIFVIYCYAATAREDDDDGGDHDGALPCHCWLLRFLSLRRQKLQFWRQRLYGCSGAGAGGAGHVSFFLLSPTARTCMRRTWACVLTLEDKSPAT